jgi:hypothetical protein
MSSPYLSSLRQSSAFPAYQMPLTAARAASKNMYNSTTSASESLPLAAPLYDLLPHCEATESHELCHVPPHLSTPASKYGYNAYASSLE